MLGKVESLHCVCYMRGFDYEMHWYKYTIRGNYGCGYTAYKTASGLRYFMDNYGLKVDKSTVQKHDYRSVGKGILVTFAFEPRTIENIYFWSNDELPEGAQPFVGLENGSYVTLYALRGEHSTKIYRPNPNAKNVYKLFTDIDIDRIR